MAQRGGRRSTSVRVFGIFAIAALAMSCGDDADGNSDARDGGRVQAAMRDAAMPWRPPPPLETEGPAQCKGADGRMMTCPMRFGISGCCTESGGCGLLNPLANTCIGMDNPGGVDESCEPVTLRGLSLPGCCAPGGECGAIVPLSGCVPRGQIAGDQTPASCDYDPDNECTAIHVISVCDGNEDCEDGKVCAADFALSGYRNYHCTDALLEEDAMATSAMGAVSQICHAGDECEVEGYSCLLNTMYQADFAGRCRDTGMAVSTEYGAGAGEINCAGEVCDAATQKCCVPATAEGIQSASAYCIGIDEACRCSKPEGSGTNDMDAGPDP